MSTRPARWISTSGPFGLEINDRFPFDGFTQVYLCNTTSGFEVELTINHDRTKPSGLRAGYGDIAFAVDDLVTEHARFESAGLAPTSIKEFHRQGALMAKFIFVQDPDGYKIEVL